MRSRKYKIVEKFRMAFVNARNILRAFGRTVRDAEDRAQFATASRGQYPDRVLRGIGFYCSGSPAYALDWMMDDLADETRLTLENNKKSRRGVQVHFKH
jgi:hypothetical protein